MLTEEQKKERLLGIGGSDAAAVAGLSPYESPLDIYLIKIGECEDNFTSESAKWGNKLEKEVAEEYAIKMGVQVEKPEKALVHPEYYWMRCNLDFVVKNSTIIGECKTAGESSGWGAEFTDDIPTPYLLQCAHNAIVAEPFFGVTQVDIPVLFGGFGGHKHKIYTYKRNKNLEERLIEMERVFWQNHVEKRIPPTPSSPKDARVLWPISQGEVTTATPEVIEAFNQLKRIKAEIARLKKLDDENSTLLCNYMKEAEVLVDSSGSKLATWKNQKSKRLDLAALKSNKSSVYEEFLKESETRVLRIAS